MATIDGRALARKLSDETAGIVAGLRGTYGIVPGLAVVPVGENPASEVYVARRIAETKRVGMRSIEHQRLVGDVAYDEIGHARAATPVPGGVGPMMFACLLANIARHPDRAATVILH